MEEENNGKRPFLDTLLKLNIERSLHWYIRSLRILTNTYTTVFTTKQAYKESVVYSLFNRAYSITTKKDDVTKKPYNKASFKGKWKLGKHN